MKLTSTDSLVIAALPILDESDPDRIDYSKARSSSAVYIHLRENPRVIDPPSPEAVESALRNLAGRRVIRSVFLRGSRIYWRAEPRQVDHSASWRWFFFWMAAAATAAQVAVCLLFAKPSYWMLIVVVMATIGFLWNRKPKL